MKTIEPRTVRVASDGSSRFVAVIVAGLAVFCVLLAALGGPGASAQSPDSKTETPPDYRPEVSCSNAACHSQILEQRFVHEIALENGCDSCHEDQGRHEFAPVSTSPQSCLECHEDDDLNWVHADGGADCLDCHNPHASEHSRLLVLPARELCQDCHGLGEDNDEGSVHLPVAEGRCLHCHNPHKVVSAPLLSRSLREICAKCHGGIVAPHGRAPDPHAEDPEGCTDCHEVHESAEPMLLTDRFLPGYYTTDPAADYALCFSCHDEDGLIEEGDTGFADAEGRSLHRVHLRIEGKGRGCRSCHQMHSTELPRMLAPKRPMGKWQAPLEIEEKDGQRTCASACHGPRSYPIRD